VSWAADGTITDLGAGVANDINDRGVIVGYRVDDDGPEWSVATLWWNGAAHELSAPRQWRCC
jgi:hypothetical protein